MSNDKSKHLIVIKRPNSREKTEIRAIYATRDIAKNQKRVINKLNPDWEISVEPYEGK